MPPEQKRHTQLLSISPEIGLYGPDAYVLRDLASTNGTYLHGRRVSEKRKLEHWDFIRVGDTKLRFTMVENSIPVTGMPPG